MAHPDRDEEELTELYRRLCSYSEAKDARGLEGILATDYALTHMTGMVQPRDAYIAAVLDGTLNYLTTEHEEITVSVAADETHARLRSRSRVLAAVFGGPRRTWRLQQDLTARLEGGRWLLTSSRASTY